MLNVSRWSLLCSFFLTYLKWNKYDTVWKIALSGTLAGSPAILSVPILQPCLRAELLLVTVDTHTGMLQCHVPQYDAPLVPELTTALNGDHSRLPTLISDLRYEYNRNSSRGFTFSYLRKQINRRTLSRQILDNSETLREDLATFTGHCSRTFTHLASSGSPYVQN